jgi:hypothetical protein
MNSSGWTLLPDHSYERPLGTLESAFYWFSNFSRATDMIRCAQVKVATGNVDEIINLPNVVRAWTNVKMLFPSFGGRLHERDSDIFLNVSEDRLLTCRPNEISFHEVSSCSDAMRLADSMLEMDRLSNDLLAHIIIARDQSRSDLFYFLFTVTHIIADGMSCMSIIKIFVNELCSVSSDSTQSTWEERLSFCVPCEQLNPAAKLNKARQRWRNVTAAILAGRLMARLKACILPIPLCNSHDFVCWQGGHSLPQKMSDQTQLTPARSAHRMISIPPNVSTRIIQTCRNKGITFGNAYPIIAQVATSRLLLRHYLEGKIDEDEWDFRKKELMFTHGPVNLRPLLEPEWLAAGGTDKVILGIDFFRYPISFLPLGQAAGLKPGMALPEVGNLLTRERFFYRATLVQKQAKALLGSPLFLEIGESMLSQRRTVESGRGRALQWKGSMTGNRLALSDRVLTPQERAARPGFVAVNGGSSIGNVSCESIYRPVSHASTFQMDKLIPCEYPMTSHESSAKARLQLGQVFYRLRCNPGELYLGAVTMQKQLTPFVHFDSNVFDEALVDEWLTEVKLALEFYLGEEYM